MELESENLKLLLKVFEKMRLEKPTKNVLTFGRNT